MIVYPLFHIREQEFAIGDDFKETSSVLNS